MSKEPEAAAIRFTLNDQPVELRAGSSARLLDVLRDDLALTGSKEGCGEGECGACTVLLDGLPVLSCLVLAQQARERVVHTVESVNPQSLTPLLQTGATQCGACTPGVVMTATWLCRNRALLDHFGIRELMAGNLCRCTGYDGIIDGITGMLELGDPR